MSQEQNQSSRNRSEKGEPLPNSAVEKFFQKMNSELRWPKPSEEAIAAALRAIQTLAGDAVLEGAGDHEVSSAGAVVGFHEIRCSKCGGESSAAHRFCGHCGSRVGQELGAAVPQIPPAAPAPEQHVHHHHHHHHFHYFPPAVQELEPAPAKPGPAVVPEQPAAQTLPPMSEPILVPPPPPIEFPARGKAAEPSLNVSVGELVPVANEPRKLVEDWAAGYKIKRLDKIIALYHSDGLLLRPDFAPARGHSGIRACLQDMVDVGIADLRLECADVHVLAEFAYITGSLRVTVPGAAGREQRNGKFLILSRRDGNAWKIMADLRSLDSATSSVVTAKKVRATPGSYSW